MSRSRQLILGEKAVEREREQKQAIIIEFSILVPSVISCEPVRWGE